jgi:hypothetical protein
VCGTDKAGFHQVRRFKGAANLEKPISLQHTILVRFPHTPVMFQDWAALGHKLGMVGTILGYLTHPPTRGETRIKGGHLFSLSSIIHRLAL